MTTSQLCEAGRVMTQVYRGKHEKAIMFIFWGYRGDVHSSDDKDLMLVSLSLLCRRRMDISPVT